MRFDMSLVELINVLIISTGIGICNMCLLQISLSRHTDRKAQRYFQILFSMILVYIMTHLVSQLMDGMTGPGLRTALYVLIFVEDMILN